MSRFFYGPPGNFVTASWSDFDSGAPTFVEPKDVPPSLREKLATIDAAIDRRESEPEPRRAIRLSGDIS